MCVFCVLYVCLYGDHQLSTLGKGAERGVLVERHDSIKSVVPSMGVGTLPRGRKINLRGHSMTNGSAKKKKKVWIHKFGFLGRFLDEVLDSLSSSFLSI